MGLFGDITSALSVANPVGLIANGLALGGDILNFVGQQDTNQANKDAAGQTNSTQLSIAQMNNKTAIDAMNNNIELEKEFAKNGIQWRVQDANQAGISPVAALGASTPSFSPITPQLMEPNLVTSSYDSPLKQLGSGLNDMSQNISRSITATQTPAQRTMEAINIHKATTEANILDLQYKNALIETNRHAMGPGLPEPSYQTFVDKDGRVHTEYAPGFHPSLFENLLWPLNNKLVPDFPIIQKSIVPYSGYPMTDKYLGR